ncbi:MAG: Hvo_1808 family surface protein [Halanaeroarchaeum sp.]
MRDALGVLGLVGVLVLAGCVAPAGVPSAGDQPTTAPTVHPPDPTNDVLGWEDGRWYNESISVTQDDGLNDSEIAVVVDRAMARVEYVRRLEFRRDVPVEIVSRATYRNETQRQFSGVPTNASLHQDVKFEALFVTGETQSAIAQQQENRAASVLGYYSPAQDRIVIISSDTQSPNMDEITLAQELFHALQERRFNVSRYHAPTEEGHNAVSGIVEGDANYVDHLYKQRCDGGWQCLTPQASGGGGGGGGSSVNVGMLALRLQPYSDGPVFVQGVREDGGWAAVNDVYAAPPRSTEQTIHPQTYRTDDPQTVHVEDLSSAAWSIPDLGAHSVEYARFGEAGTYVALWYSNYRAAAAEDPTSSALIPAADFFSPDAASSLDQYDYDHRYTRGWDGDRLYPYVRETSAETGETGYVWKTVWDTPADAREFLEGYSALLSFHGAERVANHPGTYRIPEGPYADAFYVVQRGTTVLIVNAPTVDALSGVRAGAGTTAD